MSRKDDDSRFAYLPATVLAERVRARQVSPVEIVDEALARARASQPTLNAFITVTEDAARAEAAALEAALDRGEDPGPLAGVAVSVKDIINVKGVTATFGSLLLKDAPPAAADAVAVRRLRAAGAIVIGTTTTPEFAHKLLTDAPLFGTTRNPWALDRTAGGSSGGAAAAVAAGIGPLALATDAGGSTRLPAACTGIVGLKPTLGLMPHNQIPDGFGNFIHLGLMARTVADVALTLGVLAGADRSDPFSMAVPPGRFGGAVAATEPRGLRIAWRPLVGNTMLAGDLRAACEDALAALVGAGAAVETVEDEVENAEPTWRILQQSNWAARFERDAAERGEMMDPSLLEGIREGLAYDGREVQRAMYRRTQMYRAVQGWFEAYDFVLTPTLSRGPLAAGHKALEPIEIDGAPAGDMRRSWCSYLNLFNLTGHPAVSVPAGWDADGLPVGLQIVGPWYGDDAVLGLAAALERMRPWAERTPPHAPGTG